MKMTEIQNLAEAKHGRRCWNMILLTGDGRHTKANWQAVLDAPVDEYAEARHEQQANILRAKFPQFFVGTTP